MWKRDVPIASPNAPAPSQGLWHPPGCPESAARLREGTPWPMGAWPQHARRLRRAHGCSWLCCLSLTRPVAQSQALSRETRAHRRHPASAGSRVERCRALSCKCRTWEWHGACLYVWKRGGALVGLGVALLGSFTLDWVSWHPLLWACRAPPTGTWLQLRAPEGCTRKVHPPAPRPTPHPPAPRTSQPGSYPLRRSVEWRVGPRAAPAKPIGANRAVMQTSATHLPARQLPATPTHRRQGPRRCQSVMQRTTSPSPKRVGGLEPASCIQLLLAPEPHERGQLQAGLHRHAPHVVAADAEHRRARAAGRHGG
jgi:hypothetical protein